MCPVSAIFRRDSEIKVSNSGFELVAESQRLSHAPIVDDLFTYRSGVTRDSFQPGVDFIYSLDLDEDMDNGGKSVA